MNFGPAPNATSANVVVVDLHGKQMKQLPLGTQERGTAEINTTEFSAGIYFVNLQVNGSTVQSSKLVVNR